MNKLSKIVVNFFGSPSAGKTIAAAALFVELKKMHLDCELVAEFPKDLVLEKNTVALSNQIYVFANQLYRIKCAYDATTIAIVDSPLLLSCIYNKDTLSESLKQLILEQHHQFNNLNIVMDRDKSHPYSMVGRIHDEPASDEIQHDIIQLLTENDINFIKYNDFEDHEIVSLITSVT